MNGLQETFYIIGIVFMGVMFVLIVALVATVFVIRSKINKIHDRIEARIDAVANLAERGGEVAGLAAKVVARKAKTAIRKRK